MPAVNLFHRLPAGNAHRRLTWPACVLLLPLLVGCGFKPEGLVGQSLDDVQARLGTADSQSQGTVPASWDGAFGPRPTLLQPGDTFVSVRYSDYHGQQIHIFAVSPQVYQRVKGVSPGGKKAYVLQVSTTPKGVVF
jgi:hypothetical protein